MKRYLLDLSELYTDHRQKAYIGYRDTWTTVGCIIRTIRHTFNIESDVYICSEDGIFYPAGESVDLIRDDKTIKVLPIKEVSKENIVSDDESSHRRISSIHQESSTYEDIESILLGLPKPKRRRVRKRKIKQDADKEAAPPTVSVVKAKVPRTETDTKQNGHIRFSNEESQSSIGSKSSDELPYRNLNHTMKARVVRAVSPSVLFKQRYEPPAAIATTSEVSNTNEPTKRISKPNIKPRIIRAMVCTVEVKQEQLEASATETNGGFVSEQLQQSYQPQTVEDIDVIEIGSPTPVNGEEATHDTATPAV
uniref:Coilin_N domain-containing protein n=1 Tax=Anopheles funestus TaxID=62324 RepID=A0A182RRH0_ANOFN